MGSAFKSVGEKAADMGKATKKFTKTTLDIVDSEADTEEDKVQSLIQKHKSYPLTVNTLMRDEDLMHTRFYEVPRESYNTIKKRGSN